MLLSSFKSVPAEDLLMYRVHDEHDLGLSGLRLLRVLLSSYLIFLHSFFTLHAHSLYGQQLFFHLPPSPVCTCGNGKVYPKLRPNLHNQEEIE